MYRECVALESKVWVTVNQWAVLRIRAEPDHFKKRQKKRCVAKPN